jgi:ribosomal protein S16
MANDKDMLGGLDTLRQQITDANTNRQKLFEDALTRLRAERVGPTTAEKLYAISSALSRPTRTGKFVESLGNVGSVLGAQEAEKRKAQMDRAAMLEKYGFGQSDATIAKWESQLDMGLKMQAAAAARARAMDPKFDTVPGGTGYQQRPGTGGAPEFPKQDQFGNYVITNPMQIAFLPINSRMIEVGGDPTKPKYKPAS